MMRAVVGLVAVFLAADAALAGPAALGGAGFTEPGSGAGLNVLLVTLDTTRADRIGAYGRTDARTPSLDALAARGLRFAHAVATAPITLPSHATILTGLVPPSHGVRLNSDNRLAPSHVTLAEVLAGKGYQTAAFVSSFVLDARFGLDQGFQVYDDAVEAPRSAVFAGSSNERRSASTTDAAIAWLKGRDASKPFLAWVHYYDPHAPYAPPPPFDAQFAGRLYEGEIASVDAQLGRVLAFLKQAGLEDKTLVVVVGDHGESLGEHGEVTHSVFIYRAVTEVPFIVANPRVTPRPGVVDGGVVSTADVTPTVLDILGITDGRSRDGVSLVREKPDRRRAVYVESLVPYFDFGWAPLFGLRRLTDSYIQAPRPEFYDIARDPNELDNIHATATGEAREARDHLSATLARLLERWPPYQNAVAPAAATDGETVARLQSLGYLGGAGPAGGGTTRADPKDMIEVTTLLIDANVHLSAGRLPTALATARRALAKSPGDRSVLQALAKIYLRMNRLKDAEDALRAFTAIQPRAETSLLLAQILILDGRHEEAQRLLAQAEALDARHGGIYIARGDLLSRQGKKDEARAAYEKAIAVDPYRSTGAAKARIAALH